MASPKYQNSKTEEWARWRRRDHANIEAMQNLVFEAIAKETGKALPPRVRHFISALQSAHGGGAVRDEPFVRSHLTVAQYMHFGGDDEAKKQRVRRLINQLEDYQKLAGYRFFFVERGGAVVDYDTKGDPVYSKTHYIDLLKPLADDGVMRARDSITWKEGTAATGGKPHPGLALAEQVPSVLAALPRVDERPEQKAGVVLSLADYLAQRERTFESAFEKYAEGVAERGGDPELALERIEVLAARVRQSLHRTREKQKTDHEETRQREADAPLWGDDVNLSATAHTAYNSEPDDTRLPECPEELTTPRPEAAPPTKLTPPLKLSVSGVNDFTPHVIAGFCAVCGVQMCGRPACPELCCDYPRDGRSEWICKSRPHVVGGPAASGEPDMLTEALWCAAQGWRVVPLHEVFDDICTCTCSPKKCKGGSHGCGSECDSKGKHPRIGKWQLRGTTDPEQIRLWWEKWPTANVGALMGGPTRLVALDFDPKNGGDASLHDLIAAHGDGWLDTRTHLTGSLGRHFFFQYPEGVTLHNSAGEVGPGVDTRAEGGYVVLPPSLHASGRRYEVVHVAEVRPAPDWLLAVFLSEAAPPMVVDFQERRASRASVPSGPRFAEGERNTGLFGVGIGRWRHGWASTTADLRDQLREVNEGRCSPPLVDDEVMMLAEHIARDYAHLRGVDAEGRGRYG